LAASGNGVDVVLRASGDVARVEVSGEIDLASAARFEACVSEALAMPCRSIVIDLSHCTFFDSSGLRVLAHAARIATDDHQTVTVTGVTGVVRRVFDIANMGDLLTIDD
jgi:anti-sigma B factor antagonist